MFILKHFFNIGHSWAISFCSKIKTYENIAHYWKKTDVTSELFSLCYLCTRATFMCV